MTDAPPEDFSDREAVEAWLRTQPREVSVALAARAALRFVPLLETLDFSKPRSCSMLSATLRCGAAAIFAVFETNRNVVFGANAAAANSAVAYAEAYSVDGTAASAAAAIAYDTATAASLVSPAHAVVKILSHANSTLGVIPSSRFRKSRQLSKKSYFEIATDNSDTLRFDLNALSASEPMTSRTLCERPLWQDHIPDWAVDLWASLKAALPPGDGWEVWTEWYEARLRGDPYDLTLESARVLKPSEEDWADPKRANAKLKEIDERFRRGQPNSAPKPVEARLAEALATDPLRAALAEFTYAEAIRRMAMLPFPEDWTDGDGRCEPALRDIARSAQFLAEDIEDERINARDAQRLVRELRRYESEAKRGPRQASLSLLWETAGFIYRARLDEATLAVLPSPLVRKVDSFVDNHLAFFRAHAGAALERARGLEQVKPAPGATVDDVFHTLRRARDAMRSGAWREGMKLDERGLVVIDQLIDELSDFREQIGEASSPRLEGLYWTKAAATAVTIVRYGYRAAGYAAAGTNLLAAAKTLWPETFGVVVDAIISSFPAIPDVDAGIENGIDV